MDRTPGRPGGQSQHLRAKPAAIKSVRHHGIAMPRRRGPAAASDVTVTRPGAGLRVAESEAPAAGPVVRGPGGV
eukprot:415515-Hanusia_phi.AAC.1